jgi:hypothetical protein
MLQKLSIAERAASRPKFLGLADSISLIGLKKR